MTTTINKQAQDVAIAAVRDYGPTYNTEGLRIGLASVRPGTGEIVAMYGGKNYLRNQLNDATQSTALAGSTFAVRPYCGALEQDIGLYSTWDGSSRARSRGYTRRTTGM